MSVGPRARAGVILPAGAIVPGRDARELSRYSGVMVVCLVHIEGRRSGLLILVTLRVLGSPSGRADATWGLTWAWRVARGILGSAAKLETLAALLGIVPLGEASDTVGLFAREPGVAIVLLGVIIAVLSPLGRGPL